MSAADTLLDFAARVKSLPPEVRSALKKTRSEFLTVGIYSLIINCLMLAPSIYMLQVYDRVLVSQSELTLLVSTLILVALLVLVGLIELMRSRLLVRVGIKLDQSLSPVLFGAALEAQRHQLQNNPTQVFSDLTQIRQFLTGNGIFAFFDAPWFFVYLGVLFLLHPMLGWLGLGCAVVLICIAWLGHRMTAQPNKSVLEKSIVLNSDQLGKFRNAEVIHAMGMLENLRLQWWQRYQNQALAQGHLESMQHRLAAFSKFFRYTQQSLSLGMGALLVIQGELSPGAMIVGNMLMSRALQPLDLLVSSWRMMAAAQVSLTRVMNLLHAHPLRASGKLSQTPFGQFELRGLTVKVPGRTAPVLDNISLNLPAGRVICIIGPSASGKSSLVRALLGLGPQREGTLLLDSAPMDQWDAKLLGQHIGYLPQDVGLLDGTLAQNIARFGKLDPEKVAAAAKTAGIHHLLLSFPKGYDTPVGEAGHLLSAGQRQRLALARALYDKPAILVLDEPNSNLDEIGEQSLLESIRTLKQEQKTVLLISHRKSILELADLLLVMNAGRISHMGPAQQVMAQLQASEAGGQSA
jgi:ATP-binding cassette subfamily C exporter for protease/lipase